MTPPTSVSPAALATTATPTTPPLSPVALAVARSPHPPQPHRHWRVRPLLAGLVAAVLLLHLGLLEWLGQQRRLGAAGGLTAMAEPEFNQAMALGSAPPTASPSAPGTHPPPPPTVGQVVQARTIAPPSPPKPTPPPPTRAAPPRPKQHTPSSPPPALPKSRPTNAALAAPTVAHADPAAGVPPPPAQATGPATDVGSAATTDAAQVPNPTTPPAPTPPAPTQAGTSPPSHSPPNPAQATAAASAPISSKNEEQNSHLPLDGKGKSAINGESITPQWLNTWPPSTRLNYTLKGHYRGDLHGSARVQWQRTGEQYQAQVQVSVGFFLNMGMTSQGRITPERLWPTTYQEDRRGKTRLVRMGEQQVVLDNGTRLPRPAALQDTASQFVQLAQDFASGRQRLAVGEVVQVMLARPGGVDAWTYDVAAEDTLPTALGPVQAFHLRPRPLDTPRGGVMAEMWFAPALRYQPARIRLTLGPDTWLELTLESASQTAEQQSSGAQ